MSRRARVAPLALLLSLVVAGTGGASPASAVPDTTLALSTRPAAMSPAANGFRFVDIPARDGVVLKANVIEPTAPGPRPAIVFVNSWGLNDLEYLAQARQFAGRGYVVLSYTTRGFWGSGGQIDTAGPLDIADVSATIDWLLANTDADPARIGVAGASYGSGIALIAAGYEPRIKAVAAMSTWTDLVGSLYGNETRRGQAVGLLKIAADLFGRPSPELSTALDRYFDNRDSAAVREWARRRGAAAHLDEINRNGAAIMIANSYGDSLFPPNQLVDFFGRLTVPKRLEFAPGDHVIAEATGLAGLPNHVWTNVQRWFEQHLLGVNNGVTTEKPVWMRSNTGAAESYPDWAGIATSRQRYPLGAMRWYDGTGPLGEDAGTGWQRNITAGLDTLACGGIAILSKGWEALTGIQQSVWLPAVNRLNAGAWVSEPLEQGAKLRGIPKLHLTVTSSEADTMVVAYLYEVDGLGVARLISHAPHTGGTANTASTVDIAFPATAYDIPAGRRLAVVVDTEDPLYIDTNRFGTRVSFTSPPGNASWLEIATR